MGKIYNISLFDELAFAERVGDNQNYITIIDTLFFQDEINLLPTYITISDHLDFHQLLKYHLNDIKISLSDNLILHDNVTVVFIPFPIQSIKQTITFIETLTVQSGMVVNDIISFIENLIINHNQHLSLNQNLIFNNYVQAYKIPFNSKLKPNLVVDQIYIDPIVIEPRTQVEFTGYDGSVFTLLRPSFGNKYKTNFNHIQRETMGRNLIIGGNDTYEFRKSIKSLNFKFEFLKEQESDGFINFLNQNLGLPITIKDHESQIFNVLISTPELRIEHLTRQNRSIEFEAEILPS